VQQRVVAQIARFAQAMHAAHQRRAAQRNHRGWQQLVYATTRVLPLAEPDRDIDAVATQIVCADDAAGALAFDQQQRRAELYVRTRASINEAA